MGFGLLFKVIPWGDVIAAAPAVVDGAKKLWGLARDRKPAEVEGARPQGAEGRVRQLEAEVAELRRESAASSELIKSLAEQNAQLVKAVDILRVRTRALLAATAIAAVLLAIVLVRMFVPA
jgi:hypothetical protein